MRKLGLVLLVTVVLTLLAGIAAASGHDPFARTYARSCHDPFAVMSLRSGHDPF